MTVFANQQLEQARRLHKNQNYQRAVKVYDALLKKQPDDFTLNVETARAYSGLDKHKKAIQLYQKALTINPKAHNLYLPLGWQLLWDERFPAAKASFNKYLAFNPGNKSAERGLEEANNPTLLQFRVLIRDKKYKQASGLLDKLNDIDDEDTLINMARVASHVGNHQQAIFFYNKVFNINPKLETKLLLAYANQLLWNKQYKEAEIAFNKYLKTNPKDLQAKHGLLEAQNPVLNQAHLFVEKRKFAPAIAIYKKLIKQQPNNPAFLTWLGRAYAHNDKHIKAAKTYKRALKLEHNPKLYLPIAQQYLWAYRGEPALKYFKLAKKHNKLNKKSYTLGIIEAKRIIRNNKLLKLRRLLSDTKIKQAEAYADDIETIDPNNDAWLAAIADIFAQQGYHKYSSKFHEQAVYVSPVTEVIYLQDLAWDYIWLNKIEKGCAILRDLYYNSYSYVAVLNGYGYCLGKQVGPNQAIEFYQYLMDLYPGELEWKLRTADTYIDVHKYKEAEQITDQLASVLPYDIDVITEHGKIYSYADENMKAAHYYRYFSNKFTWSNRLKTELARSYYWLGLYEEAYNVLNNGIPYKTKIEHDLFDVIQRASSNRLYLYSSNSTDSNDYSNNALSLEWQHFLTRKTSISTQLAAGNSRQDFSEDWFQYAFELQTQFGGIDSSYGIIWPSVNFGSGKFGPWYPFLWGAKLRWFYNDHIRNRLVVGNEMVYSPLALDKQVLFTRVDNIFTLLERNWQSNIHGQIGRFSDDNTRYLISGNWLYRLVRRYNLFIGPNVTYFANTSSEINNGYYNPKNYFAVSVLAKATFKFHEIYFYPHINIGVYHADDPTSKKRSI